jgi:hypothetical protein
MSDAVPAAGAADTADLHAWQILSPLLLAGGYLPWTSGSMRPSAMVTVCNEVVHGARERIVECGSGASTVLLARLLRERGGGTLTALEHDGHWAALVAEQLRREELDSIARVLHAPLGGEPEWYGAAGLAQIPGEVELLIVDGPPACDPGMGTSRAPALPWFEERLTADAAVFLDDVDRPGEREVIAGWEAAGAWRFAIDAGTGLARGQRA